MLVNRKEKIQMRTDIYFCFKNNEDDGFYVAAETRNRARSMFADETGHKYADVRSNIARRGVVCAEKVFTENTPQLARFGLGYREE